MYLVGNSDLGISGIIPRRTFGRVARGGSLALVKEEFMIRRLWGLCAVALLAAGALPVGAQTVARPAGSVVITGELGNRVFLTFEQFAALPLASRSLTVTFQAGTNVETHSFKGFLLFDVLNSL